MEPLYVNGTEQFSGNEHNVIEYLDTPGSRFGPIAIYSKTYGIWLGTGTENEYDGKLHPISPPISFKPLPVDILQASALVPTSASALVPTSASALVPTSASTLVTIDPYSIAVSDIPLYVNGSGQFLESVTNALKYLASGNPFIPIAVYSTRFHQWFGTGTRDEYNGMFRTINPPISFKPLPIGWRDPIQPGLSGKAIPHIPVPMTVVPPKFEVDDNCSKKVPYELNKYALIYVFDFDCTLTTTHSGGMPNLDTNYFSDQQLVIIRTIFSQIVANGNLIIILSRGSQSKISLYMKTKYLDIFNQIYKIIGALNEEEIRQGTDRDWALWKTDRLISIHNFFPHEKITFLDDTDINIDVASRRGIRCFHVKYDKATQTNNLAYVYNRLINYDNTETSTHIHEDRAESSFFYVNPHILSSLYRPLSGGNTWSSLEDRAIRVDKSTRNTLWLSERNTLRLSGSESERNTTSTHSYTKYQKIKQDYLNLN